LHDLQCLENYRPVFQKYFGNWCVAKDLCAATTYFKRKQGYSETYDVVTEDGVIFKKDGEVIAANWDSKEKAAFKSSDDISKQDESRTIVILEEALKENGLVGVTLDLLTNFKPNSLTGEKASVPKWVTDLLLILDHMLQYKLQLTPDA
jgi:hypothetical protein